MIYIKLEKVLKICYNGYCVSNKTLGGNRMKKIVKTPEGVRLESIVEKDGIGFIPGKSAGPATLRFGGRFATVEEESGEIKFKNISLDPEDDEEELCMKPEMDKKIKKRGFRVLLVSAILIIAAIVMMFVSITLTNAEVWINVFASVLYPMLFILILPKAIAILLGRIFRSKDMISFSKYLGAKNAVENAYYDLGRAPTMEEIKEYSIYSSEDKYTRSSYIALLWLIFSCVRFLNGWAYWLVTIAAILILCWLEWKDKLVFFQAMVVSKPEEIHYKVAIAAMEEAADTLDHVEVHFHMFELNPDPENFDEARCSAKGCPAYDFCKEESQKMAKDEGDNDPAK